MFLGIQNQNENQKAVGVSGEDNPSRNWDKDQGNCKTALLLASPERGVAGGFVSLI